MEYTLENIESILTNCLNKMRISYSTSKMTNQFNISLNDSTFTFLQINKQIVLNAPNLQKTITKESLNLILESFLLESSKKYINTLINEEIAKYKTYTEEELRAALQLKSKEKWQFECFKKLYNTVSAFDCVGEKFDYWQTNKDRQTGRTTEMLLSVLLAALNGKDVVVYANSRGMRNSIKKQLMSWLNTLNIPYTEYDLRTINLLNYSTHIRFYSLLMDEQVQKPDEAPSCLYFRDHSCDE